MPGNLDLHPREAPELAMNGERVSGKSFDSTTRIVLGLCQEIEEICADIYTYYAELHAADPILKALWERMAADELNHARIIAMGVRCRGIALHDKVYHLEGFRRSTRLLREILAGLRATRPDAETALRSALNLERRLFEFHLENVIDFVDSEQAKFFRALSRGDSLHIAQLEDAYALLLAGKRGPGDF